MTVKCTVSKSKTHHMRGFDLGALAVHSRHIAVRLWAQPNYIFIVGKWHRLSVHTSTDHIKLNFSDQKILFLNLA